MSVKLRRVFNNAKRFAAKVPKAFASISLLVGILPMTSYPMPLNRHLLFQSDILKLSDINASGGKKSKSNTFHTDATPHNIFIQEKPAMKEDPSEINLEYFSSNWLGGMCKIVLLDEPIKHDESSNTKDNEAIIIYQRLRSKSHGFYFGMNMFKISSEIKGIVCRNNYILLFSRNHIDVIPIKDSNSSSKTRKAIQVNFRKDLDLISFEGISEANSNAVYKLVLESKNNKKTRHVIGTMKLTTGDKLNVKLIYH